MQSRVLPSWSVALVMVVIAKPLDRAGRSWEATAVRAPLGSGQPEGKEQRSNTSCLALTPMTSTTMSMLPAVVTEEAVHSVVIVKFWEGAYVCVEGARARGGGGGWEGGRPGGR